MKEFIVAVLLLFCSSTSVHYWKRVILESKKEDQDMERKWWSCD